MKEQTRLSKEQVDGLLEDRRVHMEESDSRKTRDQDKIQMLTEKWMFYLCFHLSLCGWLVSQSVGFSLSQSISRKSVFLSARTRSASDYAHSPMATSAFHVSQQIDMAGEHLLCPSHSFRTSCRLLHEPLLCRHTGLLQTSTEGVPVSLSGCHVADYSTSEELS